MILKQNYNYFLLEIKLLCKEKILAYVSETKQKFIVFIFNAYLKVQQLFVLFHLCSIDIMTCF